MSRGRGLAWALAVAAIAFGTVCLVLTGWCVEHDLLFPDGGRWTRGDGVTTHGEVVWQGVVLLLLGLVVGPLWSLNDWIDDRRTAPYVERLVRTDDD